MNPGKVAELNREAGAPFSNGEGGGSAPSGRDGAKSLRDLGIAWKVLRAEQIGFGSVVWVSISPLLPSIPTCGAPSGERSVARALRFGETGQVPEIEVENLSDGPILIPAHLVVTGGWQTRAVERSVVVPARSSARVPVKCVEAGRWAPRDEKSAGTFEVLERAAVRTRWSTTMSMFEQLERHGRFAAEQSTVWQHVEEELSRSPEPSHTRSYEAYLQGVKRQHREAVRKAKVAPPQEANAVVLFPRGGGFWIESYATPEALREQADDLLANLFDPATRNESEKSEPPTIDALLSMLWALPLRPIERVAGTLGNAYALSCRFELRVGELHLLDPADEAGPAVCETNGAVLAVDAGLAHLSIGGAPPRLIPKAVAQRAPSPEAVVAAPVAISGIEQADQADQADRPGQLSGPARAASAPSPGGDRASGDIGPARSDILEVGAAPIPLVREVGPSAKLASVRDSDVLGGSSWERDRAPGAGGGVGISSQERSSFGRPATGQHAPFPRAELPISQERPKISREAMRAVYARARDLLPFDPPSREDTHGYRLMRVLDGNVSWVDIRMGGDGYAVLGSHDRCDLVLASDAGIWLRHMIAICVRLEDSSVGLRLIDLKTDIPFFLEDDVPQWSVAATGPFAIRIGRHVVCGFPIGPGSEESVVEPQPHAAARAHTFDSLSRSHAAVLETSAIDASVQLMRPFRHRDEPFTIVPSAPVSQIQELIGPSASPNHVRVTLERGGMGASVEIPADSLDTGVLLGRALNCFDGGLRRIFCDAVSRAHVLLLRDREEVHAIDLCTTNGTRVAGRRIRRYRLSNDGSTLELGKKVVFRWHRRRLLDPPPATGDRGGSSADQPGEVRRDAGESGSRPPK